MTNRRNVLIAIAILSLTISILSLLTTFFSYFGEIDTLSTTCEVVTHKVSVSYSFLLNTRYKGYYGVCHIVHEWTKPNGETTTWCTGRSRPSYFHNETEAREDLLQNKPIRLYYPCFYSRTVIRYSFDEPYNHDPYLRAGLFFLCLSVVSVIFVLVHGRLIPHQVKVKSD